jgi:hypothetical protein
MTTGALVLSVAVEYVRRSPQVVARRDRVCAALACTTHRARLKSHVHDRGGLPAAVATQPVTLDQKVGGSGSTSPAGGANWPGKYAGRGSDAGICDFSEAFGSDMERLIGALPASAGCSCSSEVLELVGEAISPGCSRITVTNPSAASKAATFTDASNRFLLE